MKLTKIVDDLCRYNHRHYEVLLRTKLLGQPSHPDSMFLTHYQLWADLNSLLKWAENNPQIPKE